MFIKQKVYPHIGMAHIKYETVSGKITSSDIYSIIEVDFFRRVYAHFKRQNLGFSVKTIYICFYSLTSIKNFINLRVDLCLWD